MYNIFSLWGIELHAPYYIPAIFLKYMIGSCSFLTKISASIFWFDGIGLLHNSTEITLTLHVTIFSQILWDSCSHMKCIHHNYLKFCRQSKFHKEVTYHVCTKLQWTWFDLNRGFHHVRINVERVPFLSLLAWNVFHARSLTAPYYDLLRSLLPYWT